jgi:hypothetical protein
MNDIYIVDVEPEDAPGSITRIRDLIHITKASFIAFKVTAVPNEYPLEKRLQDWVHRFNLLKAGVVDLPIQTGILIQALMGHGDRNRIRGHLLFQNIVGADGTACRESFCPLDVDFQAYTDLLIRTLAKARPAFFLIDDDFRIDHHPPAQQGCMCPLHLKSFSRKLGVPLSREDLIHRFDARDGGEIRELWEKSKEESLLELARVIRKAIDSEDKAIPGGLCCVTSEAHFAPAIASILAGDHTPFVRINNAIYLESGHKQFPRCVTKTFRQIHLFTRETEVFTEADTCPHSRYSLSVKSHLAHIAATFLAGCHGAKYWYVKTDKDGWQDTAPFMHMLAEKQAFLDEVHRIGSAVTWLGPTVLSRMDEIWRKPWVAQKPLDFPSDDWGWRVFGRMGIAFTLGEDDSSNGYPQVMNGTAPLAYNHDELMRFISGPLLLDGEAASHFSERGMGEFLGVTAERASFPCAVELLHTIPGSKRVRDRVSFMIGEGRYLLQPQSVETRIVSSFATGSPAVYTPVAPALTWFHNALGGHVAVYGLSMDAPLDWVFFNRKHKIQLIETLTWLAGGKSPTVVVTDRDVFLLHGIDRKDCNREYLCLFNLHPDTIKRVEITLPGREFTSIAKLTLEGKWMPVYFTQIGESIQCDADAPTMEPLILRLNRRELT